MRFGFQHLAPRAGHESTLLRFAQDGQTDCVLVDSGAGVDLDRALDEEEYLAAALLTHAHIDHYRTLGKNLRHRAPVYASPGTAAALEHSLTEATKDNDVGDVERVLDALEPIEGWTPLVDGLDVEVAPVPAGHAVGAAGFLVRFRDDAVERPQHVLLTGDFTRRPCAGHPGFPADLPLDLEAAFVNVATSEGFEATATEVVEATMERALGGGRVVVATSGLAGVHVAYLLGHAAAELDRRLPIRVVGQAAKLYDSLDYDVPRVESVPTFAATDEVLDAGTVTVAGPESPTTGSTERLFAAIRDDPAALFAQVTTSGGEVPTGTACATRGFEFGNHPPEETVEDVVEELAPENVVVKHTRNAARYRDRFPASFVWAGNEPTRYDLYADGEWLRPEWLSAHAVRQIEMQRYGSTGVVPLAGDEAPPTPSLARTDPDLAAEGLDVERLRDAFALGEATASAGGVDRLSAGEADAAVPAADPGESEPVAGPDGPTGETAHPGAPTDDEDDRPADEAAFRAEVRERLEAIEAHLDGRVPDGDRAVAVEADVLQGDGVTLLQLREDLDLAHGERVRVVVDPGDGDGAAEESETEGSGDGAAE